MSQHDETTTTVDLAVVTGPDRWMTMLLGCMMTVVMVMIDSHMGVMTVAHGIVVTCASLRRVFSDILILLPCLISKGNSENHLPTIDDPLSHQTSMDSQSGRHHHEPTVMASM